MSANRKRGWCVWIWKTFMWWTVFHVIPKSRGTHQHRHHFPEVFSEEDRLIKYLLRINSVRSLYSRPVLNYSDSVNVKFGLQLIQIMDLNERDQVLTLNVWSHYEWVDVHLRWNVSEYKGVEEVHMKPTELWTPDIKLYNYADDRLTENRDAMCVVRYDGTITWLPQAVYKSSCNVDVATFPFDKQHCHLKFGSWSYDGFKLDLHFVNASEMTMDDYYVSNVWDVIETPAQRNVMKYVCCQAPFIDLTFSITIRRRATFYAYILILPCVLLTSLTLVLFWIPPESPAKMQLGMSIFMAFFVLLLLFEGNLPPAANAVPVLGTYYCLNMVLITLSSFLNVFVVNISFIGARAAVPYMLKRVMFSFVARVVCMENLVLPFKDDSQVTCPPSRRCMIGNGENKWAPPNNWRGSSEMTANAQTETVQNPQLAEIHAKLNEIRNFIKMYKERLEEKDRKEKMAKEWKALALVFDRIFFIIYISTITVSLCVVLPIIFSS
ncbi:neuronal acetylcholine receptor subunit alpha-10-like isoform X2 [Mizuhopecten yessoensis]|uniref:neuronal acetylcholine receptor subunit alpha-10-like isoform X2 n=1 Tax=Mizuhopecten yessoensis TaxID=6573 RepID=UPI000B45E10F|nr:neuronal acetylcholine receptor subunit alpha-10-like isoform X2 [Mizuhopecten yessoensis]XP_021367418.1 neuronal acetylcholine receptor subunit alpha-10-like isoform X2 [Mizuhopecten yessoensis]